MICLKEIKLTLTEELFDYLAIKAARNEMAMEDLCTKILVHYVRSDSK